MAVLQSQDIYHFFFREEYVTDIRNPKHNTIRYQ
jgi:hypothetical protein